MLKCAHFLHRTRESIRELEVLIKNVDRRNKDPAGAVSYGVI